VRAGLAPVDPPPGPAIHLPPPRGPSVGDILEIYLRHHIRLKARDPNQVEWVADRLLNPLRGRDATTLSRREITTFLDGVADKRGNASAYRAGSVLRAAFRYAVRRGDLETDPTHLLALPSPGRARERVLSDAELAHLLGATAPVRGRLARVLVMTGLRLREAADAPVT
jgi:site-specific recombinase XerD